MAKIRTYSELKLLPTFEERFEYLKLDGVVGEQTFGWERYLNQSFYKNSLWRKTRNEIIVRDLGLDLGMDGYAIAGPIQIHHMNPISVTDLIERPEYALNPEYLICTSPNTHKAIHYGDISLVPRGPIERKPNDTTPWRK